MTIQSHPLQNGPKTWCALCGPRRVEKTARKTTFRCAYCDVALCTRVPAGFKSNCWTLWHSEAVLVPRDAPMLPKPTPNPLSSKKKTGTELATAHIQKKTKSSPRRSPRKIMKKSTEEMFGSEKTHEDEDGHVDSEGEDLFFDDEVDSDEHRQVVEVAQDPNTDVKDVVSGVVDVKRDDEVHGKEESGKKLERRRRHFSRREFRDPKREEERRQKFDCSFGRW